MSVSTKRIAEAKANKGAGPECNARIGSMAVAECSSLKETIL
jgi:hypothetical protein